SLPEPFTLLERAQEMPSVLFGLVGSQSALLRVLPVPAETMVTPLTSQTFVGGVGGGTGRLATGPQREKSTAPTASSGLVAPVTVTLALSVTAVPCWTVPGVPSWCAATG